MSRNKKNKGKQNKSSRSQMTPASALSRLPPQMAEPLKELMGIIEQTQDRTLSEEERQKLKTLAQTNAFLMAELLEKRTSLERLRHLLFGAKTEKTRDVLGEPSADESVTDQSSNDGHAPASDQPRPPGHGRRAAAAYMGARQVTISHPALHSTQACPDCESGRLYELNEPAKKVRITGVAPLDATVYECERLRCNLCGKVYTAPTPEGVGEAKYDETATCMVALLKYGTGLPFHRIEKLQEGMRIPLPATTQWDLVQASAKDMTPVHEELICQAAQGNLVFNDDTTMKVLQITRAQRAAALAPDAKAERTGVFTSGIVATRDSHQIALFFTGVRHAGENLAEVLKRRAKELPAPIQMCDMLASNTAGNFETVLAGCNAHARRRYVEVAEHFPEQVRFVLETLSEVYKTDALARQQNLDPAERLQLHQSQSAPRMQALHEWMREQIQERKVEPNSSLGEAILHMQKHWDRLTLFLRVPNAPLDSNIVERALKKAILHRRNALFYKTLNGAHVGDVFMSLIHTAELNGVGAFDYLVALQRHADQILDNPSDWMPWNYQATLARHTARNGPS